MKSANGARASGPAINPEKSSAARKKRQAARVAARERRQPLRVRTLELLAAGERSSSELAEATSAAGPSMSRLLGALRKEGLVAFTPTPGDRRGRVYALTAAGEVELSRHRAYREPKPAPPAPGEVETSEFLHSALDAAVQMRRQKHDLEGAATRLSVVLRQARKREDGVLVIEAISELATTLRQCRVPDQVQALLDELEEIALGKKGDPLDDSTLVLPALAHREYALGRLGDGTGREMLVRADHLINANILYGQLAAAPRRLTKSKWKERQAWSKIALARNLRARSDFEEALARAVQALELFDEIEDPYGRSNCFFSIGVCLRLLGAFDQSLGWLDEAHELAAKHSFSRFQAEALLQKGEVLRCRGDLDEAWETLRDALERSADMRLEVTRAFALSALGAVAFHQSRFETASEELTLAQKHFANLRHREGMALTARRQAAVIRHLARETTVDQDELERMIAFSRTCYRELGSPPGVVACEIERGRLRARRDGGAPDTVAELLDLIDNRPDERSSVELDPWVPRVLCDFAAETDDDHFKVRCESLLESGEEKLRKRVEEGDYRTALMAGHGEEEREEAGARGADEMGGETRQKGNQTTERAIA